MDDFFGLEIAHMKTHAGQNDFKMVLNRGVRVVGRAHVYTTNVHTFETI